MPGGLGTAIAAGQKVVDRVVVHLQVRQLQLRARSARQVRDYAKDCVKRAAVCLRRGPADVVQHLLRAIHRVRLARARLAVGKNGRVDSSQEVLHRSLGQHGVDLLLRLVMIEDGIQFAGEWWCPSL